MSNSIVEEELQLATTGPTTLLGFPSTDVAEGHNDNHTEHNEQPSQKKKHVYRKEAQKSYRQRLKTKEAEIETAYVQSKQEKETLTTSIHFLQENQRALELLNVEAEHLLNHLLKAQKTLPADDPYQAADNMLELSYSGTVPNDDDVRRFMSLPPPAAAKLEIRKLKGQTNYKKENLTKLVLKTLSHDKHADMQTKCR